MDDHHIHRDVDLAATRNWTREEVAMELRDAISTALSQGLFNGDDIERLTDRVVEVIDAWTAELPDTELGGR